MKRPSITGDDVTVVIPTIPGREQLLDRALASVKAQVVAPRTTVIEVDRERHGAAWCRNAAIEKVRTEWIAWLDDDDELKMNHIRLLVRAANRTGADMIFSYAEFVSDTGESVRDPLACPNSSGQLVAEPLNVPFGQVQRDYLRYRANFIPVTYIVRTKLVRDVGGFPEPYTFEAANSRDCEDYGLLIRLLDAGAKFYHLCGVRTWRYHLHANNLGGRGLDRIHEDTRGPAWQ